MKQSNILARCLQDLQLILIIRCKCPGNSGLCPLASSAFASAAAANAVFLEAAFATFSCVCIPWFAGSSWERCLELLPRHSPGVRQSGHIVLQPNALLVLWSLLFSSLQAFAIEIRVQSYTYNVQCLWCAKHEELPHWDRHNACPDLSKISFKGDAKWRLNQTNTSVC